MKSTIKDSDRSGGHVTIFNVKEKEGNATSCADFGKASVKEIFSTIGVVADGEVTCKRVGSLEKYKCRLLRVTIGEM